MLNNLAVRVLLSFLLALAAPALQAASSVALGYTPKYASGFDHFDYVNPNAPRAGELILSGFGNFDSFNPYVLKGVPADGLGGMVFEPLMIQAQDEPYGLYAHIASDIRLAPDRLSATFTIDSRARFSNGRRVTATDVKYTFDTLKGDKGHPYYRFYWADLKRVVVLDKQHVRFDFARVNPELHMIAAQVPVIAPEWAGKKPFDKVSKELPIGTGPYVVEKFRIGKDLTYKRRKDYWAEGKNTRKGMFNFDRITYKYYKDATVQLEALKAGEFDFVYVLHSKQWARDYEGPQFDDGRIIKTNLAHRNSEGMQGFVFNTRRELFKDVRVRKALALAFDFEWSNRNLFYNQYRRCDSYFSNSELASSGVPTGKELQLLAPYRKQLPPGLFTEAWKPSEVSKPSDLRRNLIEAKQLLEQAGWKVKDGVLKNKAGKSFEFDFLLAQKGFERILAPYAHNLARLGIKLNYRTVDVSLYIRRQRTFDFDMMVTSFSQSQSPGNELYGMWHSRAANQEGTRNLPGIQNLVVDAMIDKVVFAKNRKQLITAAHALDRVMLWGEYLVPNWYIDNHRIAYWDKFDFPKTKPLYYQAEDWVLSTWWRKSTTPDNLQQ